MKKHLRNKFFLLFIVPFLLPLSCANNVKTYNINLFNDYDGGLTLTNLKAKENEDYVTDIKLDIDIIKDKNLPEELGEKDVLCIDKPISFTYNLTEDKNVAKLNIPKENIKGDIKINITLKDNIRTFSLTLNAGNGEFPNGEKELTLNVTEGQKLLDIKEYVRPINFPIGYHFTHYLLLTDPSVVLNENDNIPYSKDGATYIADTAINEINVSINPNGGTFPGKEEGETINLTTVFGTPINQIKDYPGEPTLVDDEFLYYIDSNKKQYSPEDIISIPGLELELTAIYKNNLSLTLNPNGGVFPEGAVKQFRTYSGITLNELEGYMEPTKVGYIFKYWTHDEEIYYGDTKIDLEGIITFKAYFDKCEHPTFENFNVINNQLYGTCPVCKETVLISDSYLPNYKNKFLVLEEKNNVTTYTMYDISEMSSIIANLKGGDSIDFYFINDIYTLDMFRYYEGESVKVNIHGLFKNDGETISAGVNCTKSTEYPFPREYGNVELTFDNLIMIGENSYDAGFYFGLYCRSNTYNNCQFIGKQSFYSPKVVCNNCEFDCTGMESQPDYAIYTYSCGDATLNNCNFKTDGKAFKIYRDGYFENTTAYNLVNCNFYNIGKIRDDKAAIEINSQFQTKQNPYYVNLTSCTQDGFNGLYNDVSDNSVVTVKS